MTLSDIAIPQPPRIPDAARRIAIFRAFLATSELADQALIKGNRRQSEHLAKEAQRLLEASRS